MNLRIAVALATGFLFSSGVFAQGNPPQNGQTTPPAGGAPGRQSNSGPRPYSEVITSKAKTSRGLLTIHRLDDKYFFEIPDSLLNREILVVNRISKAPAGARAGFLGYAGDEISENVITFEKGPANKIFLRSISYSEQGRDSAGMYQSVRNSNLQPINAAFPVAAFHTDFMENPPKKFFRLYPGGMVRLKYAYIIRCDEAIKDDKGNIIELRCSYIPESRSGHDTSGINVKGTLHWVEVTSAITAEVRLYDRLFKVEDPSSEAGDFKEYINPDSLKTLTTAYAEPALKNARINERYQFLRKGYFTLDNKDTYARLVFNRTVTLKDAWAKEQKKG